MRKPKMKVAFLDRDGVINKEVNYLYKINDFDYTYRCVDGLKILNNLGYEIIVVTNQSGIARGYYTEEEYQNLTAWYLADLKKDGVNVLDVLHCPHHPDGIINSLAVHCNCRKPLPGMLFDAISRYEVDLESSLLVGDKLTDIEAGRRSGISNLYLVESGHVIPHSNQSVPVFF